MIVIFTFETHKYKQSRMDCRVYRGYFVHYFKGEYRLWAKKQRRIE